VTDLVQGLKCRAESLTEDQIAYIIRETVEVTYIGLALQMSAESCPKRDYLNTIYSRMGMDGHLKDGRTNGLDEAQNTK
jgi:hypothetical protein